MTENSTRTKHPANGARIAATGISTTSLLAIMVALGSTPVQDETETAEPTVNLITSFTVPTPRTVAVAPAIPAQSGVTATQLPPTTLPLSDQVGVPNAPAPLPVTVATAAPVTTAAPAPVVNEPVQLTPTQVVTVITSAPAPAQPAPKTKTKGS